MSGVLTVYCSAATGKITIPNPISVEKLTLKMYRYEYDTDAHAQAASMLTFTAPWTRVGSIAVGVDKVSTDATFQYDGLTIPVGNTLSNVGYTELSFDVGRVIERTFDYAITGFDLTGFANLLLVFEYKLK